MDDPRPSLRSELLVGLRVLLLTLAVLIGFLLLGALVVPAAHAAEGVGAPVSSEVGPSDEHEILLPEMVVPETDAPPAETPSTAPSHAPGAENSGGLPQFKAEWFPSQLFWLGVTFAVMLVFFGAGPLPRLNQILMAREQQIRRDMDSAEELSARARKIREAYEASLVQARNAAHATLREEEARFKAESDARLQDFRVRFTRSVESAGTDLATARQALMGELSQIAAETAAHASSTILQTPEDLEHAQKVIAQIQKTSKAA